MFTYTMTYGLDKDSPARMIRTAVFMNEQGFKNEFDDQDQNSYHFIFFEDDQPVSCARLFKSPDKKNWMTLGRVAVLKNYRNRHYGLKMLEAIEKEAVSMQALGIELSAQLRVQSFYEKAGYSAVGDIYMDEHCEHIHMEKIIKQEVS